MAEKEQKEKKAETNWDDVIANEVTFFQLNGRMGRFAFFVFFAGWGAIERFVLNFEIIGLWHLVNIACFISTIFAVQKRCRDFHYDGTILILGFSPWIYLLQWWNYIRVHDLPTTIISVLPYHSAMIIAGTLTYLFLIFMPGKKEKTFTETSILLKYPTLYFGVWSIIYFVGFYVLFGKII